MTAEFLGDEETSAMFAQRAEELEEAGQLKEAEQLYISIGQANKAMYVKAKS